MFSDVLSWVATFLHNQPICGHFVKLSLFSGESLAGPACFCWKSNWTKIDHLGSTGGHWETISGSFSIPFGSYFFVECHTHTNKHCHCYWCHGLILSLDNWKEHTIPLHVICLLWRLCLQMLIFARNLQQVSASGHEACPSNARVQHPCKKWWNSLLIFLSNLFSASSTFLEEVAWQWRASVCFTW